MASINGITTIHICANEVPLALIFAESVSLVGGCVGPQNGAGVDVVGVCSATANVVQGETEGVEVLGCGDNGEERVVFCVVWEARFDELAG